MKYIVVHGAERMAVVDDSDYERVAAHRWIYQKPSRPKNKPYVRSSTKTDGMYWALHRFILGLRQSRYPLVDHKNGDTFDCQRDNLRTATYSANSQNAAKRSHQRGKPTRSGFKGVQPRDGYARFRARIRLDGKLISLGDFPTEVEAARAYNEAAQRLFGEFARLNEVD